MARTDDTTESRGYRPEGVDDVFTEGRGAGASDTPPAAPKSGPALPALGVRGTLRWTWRQLTSMRVALMLLMLLAAAAVPGSVLPQRRLDAGAVQRYLDDHATLGPWLDRLGFFEVYSSVWFSAIYILLFVSLVGCILPRTGAHLKQLRARPPRTPRRFDRFPARAEATTDAGVDEVVGAAVGHLRGRLRWLPRFRVVAEAPSGTPEAPVRTVAAERGYLRETGNLVFHLALVGLLVSVATGQLLHYRGQAILTEGRGFANAVVDYDSFENGKLFRPSTLVPFTMRLDSFDAKFTAEAQPRDFTAHVTVTEPGEDPVKEQIKVNHPLTEGGAKVYLQGNGFAPSVTVRDADGQVAFSGPVPFVPQDNVYTSRGVIKVPDVSPGLDQLGFVGFLLPTAEISDAGALSLYPQPYNPRLVLDVYSGDLGLDDGVPQNVYRLDTDKMTAATDKDGKRVSLILQPGQTVKLPDGKGTMTFDSLPRYVGLDLRYDPSLVWVLTFALTALGGLILSLFVPRRRVWLRVTGGAGPDGRTVITVAGLARHDDAGLQNEVDSLVAALPGASDPPGAPEEPAPPAEQERGESDR
ncbi:cytochrome c biogenesis protein ResB [Cellulomonas sp. PhB143]|uniref:cytochrome c biogenesis protein ResB n=1 Tax=Cellulomonas sp. PhB143 TaxID=2485186 RepID=UPI000F46FFB0|nr:cytochrome c biogenesis protein ResB [Cellulomonas sp. PhB143]ROS76688.1 cytochrome c biogenesis protein [Cellulomonas sp. PhB143]